ncbi:MAG: hypothetical protein MUE59_11560 [Thiobacillaceae bacterium]|nr:hypothetical protein [Thiobacillaceae bacterium]
MKYSNRSGPSRTKLAALIAAGLAFGAAQNAMAAGTASGTSISNTATLSYAVGGVPQTDIPTTSASFLVDNKVNLTVAEVGGSLTTAGVVPGVTGVVTTFTVTNNGNTVQDYALSVDSAIPNGQTLFGGTDNFNVTACSAFVDSGANTGYQPGEDTATFIDELAADANRTVHVVCSVPIAQVNTDVSLVSLTATTHNGGGAAVLGAVTTQDAGADVANTVQVVFADVAGSDDAARDGKHSARDGYLVTSAVIGIAKTSTLLCDPFNGIASQKHIPGAIVRWTVQVSNTGATSATLSTITDALNASTAHDANLVVPTNAATCDSATGTPESAAGRGFQIEYSAPRALGGSGGFMTNLADGDGATIAGQNVTIDFAAALPADGTNGYAAGELKAGENATVTFNVTIQ